MGISCYLLFIILTLYDNTLRTNDIYWKYLNICRISWIRNCPCKGHMCFSDNQLQHIVCRLAREKLEVNIKKEDIDRSHRVGRKSTTKPRGIIVKLVSYRTRQEIMSKRRKLKNTGLSIHEELTKKNQKLLEETKNHSKTHNAWSKDGRIIALIDASNGGTITKLITCTEDLKKLWLYIYILHLNQHELSDCSVYYCILWNWLMRGICVRNFSFVNNYCLPSECLWLPVILPNWL